MLKNKNVIDKLFLIISSIQTVLMGVLFIVQVLRIYFGNNKTFTRELCIEYIIQILPIIILWVVIIIASYIYFYIKGNPDNKIAKITNIAKLKTLENICPLFSEEEFPNLKIEKKKRKISKIICLVIIIICSFMGISYLLNADHFKSDGDLLKQAIQMSIHLLPWVIISFSSLIITTIYEEISAKKSIDVIKQIIKSNGKQSKKYINNKKKSFCLLIVRLTIIIIAAVFIITGVNNGGATDVLNKAINICTECIGLG